MEVPAGPHTVVVANPGNDWFMAQYRLRNTIEAIRPPVLAWGMVGQHTALAWARLEERTWRNVCALKEQIPPVEPTLLTLSELPAGNWNVQVWDTWGRGVVAKQTLQVTAKGEGKIRLPKMEKDFAVRWDRVLD